LIMLGNAFLMKEVAQKSVLFLNISIYAISLVISYNYLINKSLFVLNQYGNQIQLIVYWLPMFVVCALGIVFSLLYCIKGNRFLIYGTLYNMLILIGLARESQIIPDIDPVWNVFMAFTSFALAAVVLLISVIRRTYDNHLN